MDEYMVDPEAGASCCSDSSLDILKEVQKVYEEKMRQLDCFCGTKKLEMQVELLRAWVNDLVGQNALLARTVTDLEQEATASLQKQKQRFIEMASEHRLELAALKRRLRRKDADLRGLLEVLRRLRDFDYYTLDGIHFHEREMKTGCEREHELMVLSEALQKDNIAKDRELRRLSKELQQQEVTIFELRKELAACRCDAIVPTADVGVMVGMSWFNQECGDMEPVRDRCPSYDDPSPQEKMKLMETKLKTSNKNVRALRKANVSLSVELYATRCVCAALGEECAAAKMNAEFKDEIVREMRRQLKQAKAKEPQNEARTGERVSSFITPCQKLKSQPKRDKYHKPEQISGVVQQDPEKDNSNTTDSCLACPGCLPEPSDYIIEIDNLVDSINAHQNIFIKEEQDRDPEKEELYTNQQGSPRQSSAGKETRDSTPFSLKFLRKGNDCKIGQNRETSKCAKPRKKDQKIEEAKAKDQKNVSKIPVSSWHSTDSTLKKKGRNIKQEKREDLDNKSSNSSQRSVDQTSPRHSSVERKSPESTDSKKKLGILKKEQKRDQEKDGLKNSPRHSGESTPRRRWFQNKSKQSTSDSDKLCELFGSDCICDDLRQALERKNESEKLRQVEKTIKDVVYGTKQETNSDKILSLNRSDGDENSCICEDNVSDVENTAQESARPTSDESRSWPFSKLLELKDSCIGPDSPLLFLANSSKEMIAKASQYMAPCECCACGAPGCTCGQQRLCPAPPDFGVFVSQMVPDDCAQIKQEPEKTGECSPECDVSYYREQLESANKMLKEKEETITLVSASLSLVEARAAQLSTALAAASEQKAQMADSRAVVRTLQEHLSIIEDLYRESFYETIQQDELIELLRQALSDVRATGATGGASLPRTGQDKCDSQRCQDIAAEVEGLKSEISNFLSNSNNDSGVWEEPASPAQLVDDLHEIAAQLCSLRDLLAVRRSGPCTCGLQKENEDLKQINSKMAETIGELQRQKADLMSSLDEQTKKAENYMSQLQLRKFELERSKEQSSELTAQLREQRETSDKLKEQIQQTREKLLEKCEEVSRLQQKCEEVSRLQQQCAGIPVCGKQSQSLLACPASLRAQLSRCHQRLEQSDARAHALAARLHQERLQVDMDRDSCAPALAALGARLASARAAGAALCEDAWRAVASVRAWSKRMRAHNLALKEKIKLQEQTIQRLQEQLRCCGPDMPTSSERVRRKDSQKPDETERVCFTAWDLQKKSSQTHTEAEKEYVSSSALSCSRRGSKHKGERASTSGSSASCVSATELRSRSLPIESPHKTSSRAQSSRACTCPGEDTCLDEILERLATAQLALMDGRDRWRRDRGPPPC